VNLGEYGLLTGNIEFDNTPTNIPTTAGAIYWNDADGTADLILKGGNVKLQVGQESVIRVVNKTATNINLLEANYQAVRVTGAQGQRLKVDLAQATTDNLSAETIGLVTETINNNQEGFITTSGLVRNINTTGSLQGETWADGDILYLSPTTAGRVTKVKPVAPNHLVIIGYVVHAHANQGSIFVKVDNGYELEELHNVYITSPANNQGLFYDSADSLWKNETIASALGYTPQNADLFTRMRNGWEASTDYISAVFNDGWSQRSGGSGSGISSANFLSGINKQGICIATTGTTSTGFAGPEFGSPNTNNGIAIGNGELTFEQLVMIPILSNATERFILFNGILAAVNYSGTQNGVYFYYDEGGIILGSPSPNWKCFTAGSGVRTLTVTSIAVNANQWYKLKAVINSAGTSASFYIDGNLIATHTTNMPSLTIGYALESAISKSAGTTARTLYTDYSAISQTLTTQR